VLDRSASGGLGKKASYSTSIFLDVSETSVPCLFFRSGVNAVLGLPLFLAYFASDHSDFSSVTCDTLSLCASLFAREITLALVCLACCSSCKLDSVGLDLHRLCAHLTSSIASLHLSVKPGIDLAHMTAVGIVSSIAFWIAVVMSLVTWSKSSLDLMCWLLGSPLWSAWLQSEQSMILFLTHILCALTLVLA
jgi:hypothetical protein